MKYTAIILAAGSGTRMNLGYNKMLMTIRDKPLITLTMQKFIEDINCTQLIIVSNEQDTTEIKSILTHYHLYNQKCMMVRGGEERQHSVYNGLQKVKNKIVLVHDGARPFITQSLINTLVKEAMKYGCCIPGVKVKDTIKYVEDHFIKKTIPREYLYAVQTPQACQTERIKLAHDKAIKEEFLGTDEASLIEKYTNIRVKIIESSYDNIKITTKEDIITATRIYENYFK